MIRLTCTQCKSVLEMDEAFAGGVCRCQYCGTIQTVPSHLKGSAGSTAPAGAAVGSKRLYQGGNASAAGAKGAGAGGNGTGTGLDELADLVASSGLSRSALRQGPAKGGPAAPQAGANRMPLLLAAGAVILVLLAVIIWLATRPGNGANSGANPPGTTPGVNNPDSGSTGTAPGTSTPHAGPGTAAGPGPHFQSVPISARRVVYVVDRGGSAKDIFDGIKASLYSSLDSLGANREFAVIFWGSGTDTDWERLTYPAQSLARAAPETIQACRDHFDTVSASGRTEPGPAVRRAVDLQPDAIFLITAKGSDFDSAVVGDMQKVLGGTHAKLYTIDLTNGGEGKSVLEPLATQTGGSYTKVAPGELGNH